MHFSYLLRVGILAQCLTHVIAVASDSSTVKPPDTGSESSTKRKLTTKELDEKWGGEWSFHGVSTFAHLPHFRCLREPDELYDIAVIGAPFDSATSYRPGARFGPRAIRTASARQVVNRAFNHRAGINPYQSWARVLDCGDIPITPYDKNVALEQMTQGFSELLERQSYTAATKGVSADQDDVDKSVPKIMILGGDHSLALPALKALYKTHGQLAVLHFDAHLDTWHPAKYVATWQSEDANFNHGSMFWLASANFTPPLIMPQSSVHVGLRTRLSGTNYEDYEDDTNLGFFQIEADRIDEIGTQGIIDMVLDKIPKDAPVYLSVDIDVIDPGICPGTGTPEPGGFTTREMIRMIRGLEGLNIVGADIVEVAPAYDGAGEQTALAGAQLVFEMITSMVKRGVPEMRKGMKEGRGVRQVEKDDKNTGGATESIAKDEL